MRTKLGRKDGKDLQYPHSAMKAGQSIVAAFNKPQILGIGIEFDLMMEEVEESLAWSRMPSTSLPRSLTSRFIRLASMRSESQFYNA